MQSLCRSLGSLRLYSQRQGPTLHPEGALAARAASTPLAVRTRREKKSPRPLDGATEARDGVTPSDRATYSRRLKANRVGTVRGKPLPLAQWTGQRNVHRSRLRGVRLTLNQQGQKETQVVGQPVYLPNIIFRLVRNHTPSGEPYNPYEATFRVPHSVTKTDIRSYLLAVYGVKSTYIRTDNYFAPVPGRREDPKQKTYKSYKRAVVGLVDPFYYPLRLEDMPVQERAKREEWIEDNFWIKKNEQARRLELLRITQGTVLKAPFATKRSHILKLIAERKQKRESLVSQIATEWKDMRDKGKEISWEENPLGKSSKSGATESS